MTDHSWYLSYLKANTSKHINQQPYSSQFDDVYFNDQGGLEESRHVFIDQNKLHQRWCLNPDKNIFCIAETGFGTGLNFLATLQSWQAAASRPRKLKFISCEKYPLSYEDLKLAHACFPELKVFSQLLLNVWQNFNGLFRTGLHCFQLTADVELILAFGDATENLRQLNATVDAWYLDGFAPSKNPEMWHDNLCAEINRLSRPNTSLATFTAASQVRKTLQKNGFEVVKKPGFGKKREMITAVYKQTNSHNNQEHQWHPKPSTSCEIKSVTILGGGIAGMCLAHFFKRANYQVTVIDKHYMPMQEASGNEMAMVMPLLTAQQSPESAFYVRAFEAALRFYQDNELIQVGVEKILSKPKQRQWADAILQSALPKDLIEIQNNSSAYYSTSGYVESQFLADRLGQNVDHWISADVTQIKSTASGQWLVLGAQDTEINRAELLILANGMGAQQLTQPDDLSLVAKHGMTTTIKPTNNQKLKHIQLGEGYVIANQKTNHWLCGATFDHLENNQWYEPALSHDNHWPRNLELWQEHLLFEPLKQAQVIGSHAAIRATTVDHLPVCGPIVDQAQFKSDYQDLHHGRHWQQYPPAIPMENLYVLSGLGSRGFTSAPLLAQYLCAMILAEPLPLEADLCKIIHPNRFLYRSLKRSPQTEPQP